ncbi:hypothetical protein DICPUDRAFT_38686 [Dictyostelium purpureum]|uniref:Bulb-type lectin domain-containing protein n=1 Tax=Dictyostelium purpureum TaxID=5786 RepID=F0ZUZ9_DICPU|nr:uncharacterized protein DICPUDRAFT_38686 [Dictyostelium purpureum]EGC32239.1 hypothetical protein DICPUDRAFT_38686 [Dictyostelium purpureum]|eukprot:XP_003291237.1 hypothetical protein DICPUDRAFT_38686 [Dictyostelium purpureum]
MLHPVNSIRQDHPLCSNGNNQIETKDRKFHLVMQPDGNLVIYSGPHYPANSLWASNTDGKGHGPYRLIMQGDGNLCIYDSHSVCTWSSGTHGQGIKGNYSAKFRKGQLLVLDTAKQIMWTSKPSNKSNLLLGSSACAPSPAFPHHQPVVPQPVIPQPAYPHHQQPGFPSGYPGSAYQPVSPYSQPAYPQPGYPSFTATKKW